MKITLHLKTNKQTKVNHGKKDIPEISFVYSHLRKVELNERRLC